MMRILATSRLIRFSGLWMDGHLGVCEAYGKHRSPGGDLT